MKSKEECGESNFWKRRDFKSGTTSNSRGRFGRSAARLPINVGCRSSSQHMNSLKFVIFKLAKASTFQNALRQWQPRVKCLQILAAIILARITVFCQTRCASDGWDEVTFSSKCEYDLLYNFAIHSHCLPRSLSSTPTEPFNIVLIAQGPPAPNKCAATVLILSPAVILRSYTASW